MRSFLVVLGVLVIATALINVASSFAAEKGKELNNLSKLRPASPKIVQLLNGKISSLLIHDPEGGVLLFTNKVYDLSKEPPISIPTGCGKGVGRGVGRVTS